MFQIIRVEQHTDTIFSHEIRTAPIAKEAQPGQFVLMTMNPDHAPLPLPVADFNEKKGTITVTTEAVDPLRRQQAAFEKGDAYLDCRGPFGEPSRLDNAGTVLCIAGGIGAAALLPLARAYKDSGRDVISIVGFRTKDTMFLHQRISKHSDEFYATTDDGSFGIKGRASTALRAVLQNNKDIERVVIIGSLKMMKACANIAEPFEIPTRVNLAAVITDEIWRNGLMRISEGPQQSLSFMDRLEFNAQRLDLDALIAQEKQHAEAKQEAEQETEDDTLPTESETSRASDQ
jgi:ferredoxin--NADP+ reductase